MSRSDEQRLRDARDHAASASLAIAREGIHSIWSDEGCRKALLFDLIVMSEALTKVSAERKATCPDIPWRRISDTRNRLVHAYWRQDQEFIDKLVTARLPELMTLLDVMIGRDGER